MFSYLCVETLDKLDLETFEVGDYIHLRRKSTGAGFGLAEEKHLFMELFEKHRVEIRAQFQHDGFYGTGMRNDAGQHDPTLPQGLGMYEYNKSHGLEPTTDTWPRMYTKEWLEKE